MGNLLFHLQFPPPEMAMGIVHNVLFESLENFEVYVDPDAKVTLLNGIATLDTGSAGGHYAMLSRYIPLPTELYTWNKKRTFRIKVSPYIADDTDLNCFIGFGNISGYLQYIGFKFYPTKITGIWSDLYTPSEVDLITGLAPPLTTPMLLKIVFNPGENIKFYIDEVLLATVDNDLPSGTPYAEWIFNSMLYNNTDVQHTLSFSQLRFDQDL